MFGRFHAAMAGLKYEFKSRKVLHETEKIFRTFTRIARKHWKSPLMTGVAADVAYVSAEMNRVLLPASLPLRAIHGDPKISNLLFDAKGRACGVVDLDTCNRRPLLVETGDMFRSWCGLEEDNPENEFRLDVFGAGWKGYSSTASISSRERKLVPLSVATITLELASRFLADYFNDNYFGWDSSRYASRREHNLARARGQLGLYRDVWKKMERMEKIVG
jgi:Ser/Thr protein kinase RdoA (MazF antagonist)